ncbi:2-oxoglutarate dehydrogenase E1 component [Deinococcus cellulosilyticus]|nr:2-oxoglutarate dehydrogenase E1 component [Deinococcus cellulosilyticus]
MKSAESTIMYGGSASFLEALYEDYLGDPSSVAPEWRRFFEGNGAPTDTPHSPVQQAFLTLGQKPLLRFTGLNGHTAVATKEGKANTGISAYIAAYRLLGHLRAKINPLDLRKEEDVPELSLTFYGLTDADLSSHVEDGGFKGTLAEVREQLLKTYCGSIGYEYVYIPSEERQWLQKRIEGTQGRFNFSPEARKRILRKLTSAEGLERYLHVRYVGQKRFSLEGTETLIPMLDSIVLRAGKLGVKDVVVGMAHRGRLNVLINIFGKKPSDLFAEFDGKKTFSSDFAGDVKYHMGFSSDVQTEGGPVHLALAFNPSHLEIVNPVVAGSVRARQARLGDVEGRSTVLPIVLHGDAAVAGQGVVAETLNLAGIRGFAVGGTLHIVVNNQVGFTISDLRDARTSRYCTDVAKMIDAPVFHVNADDPEACVWAAELALDYRQTFHKDVFIDLIGYRKLGHNESDDPSMTQPMMYRKIQAHPGTRALYGQTLAKEGIIAESDANTYVEEYRAALEKGDTVADAVETDFNAERSKAWKSVLGTHWTAEANTAVDPETLKKVGYAITTIPDSFKLHRGVERVAKARRDMIDGKQPLDWGMAENLAYGTLLNEGYNVRLCGEDAGRGTFTHRHAVWHNQLTEDIPEGEEYLTLAHVSENQGRVEVIDSTLSEEAVLAYEYGYAATDPSTLVLWEAQFGDFANCAQPVIDQFISSSEAKWGRLAGLVMLLPHGYEGQGPEHSSARLERFMQLTAQDNIQVVVPSTPAQVFHMLRRQIIRNYRKPLIVMTGKSLLRNPLCVSPLEDLTNGKFQEIIPDTAAVREDVNRVVLCSGKLYWELFKAREEAGLKNVAIVRIEQLYPFAHDQLKAILEQYPNAEVVWAQEEPRNMGAWMFVREDIEQSMQGGQTLKDATRPRSASPAVGYTSKHNQEQQDVIQRALGLK